MNIIQFKMIHWKCLMKYIDRDTQRRVDRLTSLLEKIEADEK